MSIKISYIITFLAGLGIMLLVIWLKNEGIHGAGGNTDLHQVIYKEKERLKQQIENREVEKSDINNYQTKISTAILILRSIATPAPFNSKDSNKFINDIEKFYTEIQSAYKKTTRGEYMVSYEEKKQETKERLDESANNIDKQFTYQFSILFEYFNPFISRRNNSAPITELEQFFKDSLNVARGIQSIIHVMNNESEILKQAATKVENGIEKSDNELKTHDKSLEDLNKTSKDRLLMVVVLPVFAIIVVLLFMIPYLYRKQESIIKKLFEEKIILQIFTVFILVIVILLLGIGDKINGETLGTLLGGISVYILQNSMGPGKTPPGTNPPEAAPEKKTNPATPNPDAALNRGQ